MLEYLCDHFRIKDPPQLYPLILGEHRQNFRNIVLVVILKPVFHSLRGNAASDYGDDVSLIIGHFRRLDLFSYLFRLAVPVESFFFQSHLIPPSLDFCCIFSE